MGPGPNATEAEKEEFREMSKSMSANMIGLMWQITKMDIVSTLIGVCNKILHDHSCAAELLTKRREALFILGEAYYAKCGDINAGLEELTNKVGMQSGMFGGAGGGPDGDVDATADGKTPSSPMHGGGAGMYIISYHIIVISDIIILSFYYLFILSTYHINLSNTYHLYTLPPLTLTPL